MLQGPVLIDIFSVLKQALEPLVEVSVVPISQATDPSLTPAIFVMPARAESLGRDGAGFAWRHFVSFRVVHNSLTEAFALADLLYRAVHALEDDDIRVLGGDFGAVGDVQIPSLLGASALGNKTLTEYGAAFSFVVTTQQ